MDNCILTDHDLKIIRELAEKCAKIAAHPAMEKKRNLWYDHNDLKKTRPLILVESLVHSLKKEVFPENILECREEWARGIEDSLRCTIWHHEFVKDDSPICPDWNMGWSVAMSGYGVDMKMQHDTDSKGGNLGYHWEPPIKDIATDFEKLKLREFSVDREKTLQWKSFMENVLGGIMPVKIRGGFYWTMGLTQAAIFLIGLENLMLYMYDQPDELHRLMAFLRDDHLNLIEFLEKENLYSLNNGHDYIGSGSRGFTRDLPGAGFKTGDVVRPKNLWVLSESQETVGISPDMFAEFILPYQKSITDKFGLVYYGCCEPVHNRWEHLKTIQNLRSVSVSPWADEEFMGRELAGKYVYSRKPNPTLLSTGNFDVQAVRDDIRKTLESARDCNIEFVMKDLHTTSGHPERMAQWVSITREEIEKFCG